MPAVIENGGSRGVMGKRVLIVEDDASLARSIVDGLSDEGFTVAHATDGHEAQEALRDGGWDLVILDWWLPGADGLEVLERHRREGGATPVLFLTARDAVSDRVRGLDRGADDYLCKPFAFDELLARARALIRRGRPVEVMTLSYRDLRVDLAAQRAERAGRPLDLTAKELALLIFFLSHPDEVLSRARIYGQVWGEEYDFVSNTLEVHIKELRRTLETRGPRLIQTVRGRGYLLGDPPQPAAEEGP
jgi:two-component system copper resistance phosphate regulon response regulator CusR